MASLTSRQRLIIHNNQKYHKNLTKIYKNAKGEMLRIYSYLCSYVYNQYSRGLTKSQSVLKLLPGRPV